jgi:hypothetical protein
VRQLSAAPLGNCFQAGSSSGRLHAGVLYGRLNSRIETRRQWRRARESLTGAANWRGSDTVRPLEMLLLSEILASRCWTAFRTETVTVSCVGTRPIRFASFDAQLRVVIPPQRVRSATGFSSSGVTLSIHIIRVLHVRMDANEYITLSFAFSNQSSGAEVNANEVSGAEALMLVSKDTVLTCPTCSAQIVTIPRVVSDGASPLGIECPIDQQHYLVYRDASPAMKQMRERMKSLHRK